MVGGTTFARQPHPPLVHKLDDDRLNLVEFHCCKSKINDNMQTSLHNMGGSCSAFYKSCAA